MDNKIKKNGFTLVEILTVTVLIAILFTPLIVGIVMKSQQKSFKNEIINMVQDVDSAYTNKLGLSSKDIVRVVIDGKTYSYLCITLDSLVKEGFSNKNLDNGYGGYIQRWVGDENITFINVTNGKYYLQGTLDVINNSNFLPTKESSKDIEAASSSIKCPLDRKFPGKGVFNVQSDEVNQELEEYIKSNK